MHAVKYARERVGLADYGEPFQVWEMWPSPHSEKPVGSEVQRAGPTPTDRVSQGNQALL